MVKRQVTPPTNPELVHTAPTRPAVPRVGKAHGGFIIGLALASPVLMGLVFVLVGLLMQGARGATGQAWVVASVMFTLWGLGLGTSIILAEAEEDPGY